MTNALALLAASVLAASSPSEKTIAAVLDDFHDAAAAADGARYFAHFAPDGVFLGTDASERWTVAQFKAYAAPHFAKGHGWKYTPKSRDIALSADGDTAWFDELLDNEAFGLCRGSGVLTRRKNHWKISQYNLSVPIPNALMSEFVKIIRERSPEKSAGFKDVSVKEASALSERRRGDAAFVVLDVRTPREFGEGRIPGAINMDSKAGDFSERLALLDRKKTYLVHCAAGGRSAKSLEMMKTLGFRSVLHMKEGFSAWQSANLPIER